MSQENVEIVRRCVEALTDASSTTQSSRVGDSSGSEGWRRALRRGRGDPTLLVDLR